METVWSESHFGKDQADYERWLAARGWFEQTNLFDKPIVRHDFNDSGELTAILTPKAAGSSICFATSLAKTLSIAA